VRADWATKILWTASEKSAELPAANAAMSEGSKAKLLETNRFQDPLDDVERTFLSPAVANKARIFQWLGWHPRPNLCPNVAVAAKTFRFICHGCNSVLMLWSMFYRITVGVAVRSCASHQFCSGASS
jgi:hypothetical protein